MEGFKIIHNVSVHEARDIEQAAALVAEFYPEPRGPGSASRSRPTGR
jgi:hypothetical protein